MPLSVVAAVSLLLTAVEPSPSSAEPQAEAHSQQPAEPPAASRQPAWSIGAGVGFGEIGVIGLTSFGSAALGTTSSPRVTAFLEHRRGERSFLVLDLSATYQSGKYDQSSFGQARQRSISGDVGLRYLLTPMDSVVDVSVLALVDGALSDYTTTANDSIPGMEKARSQWSVGVSGGLVVERQLTPGVFVRISTPVVYASYGRSKLEAVSLEIRDLSSFGVGLRLAPRLELRLAF